MAAPDVLGSRIDRVQVYRRGATVTRTAELSVAGGMPSEVELSDLPLSLIDPTVRVRVTAVEPAGAEVVAAGTRVGLWVRPGDPPPKAPEQKELDDVRLALRRAHEELQVVDGEVALLQGVPVPERPTGEDGKAPPASPMAARLQLEQFIDEATQKRIAERRALQERVRELEEQEARLQERIAASSSAAEVHLPELAKSVVVRLRSSGATATKVSLELSYVVPGARWAPAYQCKLARDGSKAEIQLRAWIAQRSGEDWKGVKLKLSTASPLRYSELPELSAVKIGRAQPPVRKTGFRPPPQGGDVLFRDFDRDLQRARGLVPAPRPWQVPALTDGGDVVNGAAPSPQRPRASRRDTEKAKKMARAEDRSEGAAEAAMLGSGDALFEADDEAMDSAPEEMEMERSVAYKAMPASPAAYAPRPSPPPAPGGPPMLRSSGRAAPAKGGPPDDALGVYAYPLLRLPDAAQGGQRGRLVPLDVRAQYEESVRRFGRPVPFDVMSAVHAAEEAAELVASAALPDGAVDADDISSHFDFAYDADGVVEITGDGGFHSVALGDRACEARMRYIAVPREEASVYRVAMLLNPVPAPLLPGPAEVYVGGEYVLTTRLPTVPARGELKLGLGVEQSIKVARNTKFTEQRSGEKVVAMAELVHDVDVDVVNHLERDIEIEVRERVPVPAPGAEVVVEELKVEPAWQPYTQEERSAPIDGGRRWEVKVGRGGTQKLQARYVVKIYAQNEIVGGNRREV